jgi:hypothetical protein
VLGWSVRSLDMVLDVVGEGGEGEVGVRNTNLNPAYSRARY